MIVMANVQTRLVRLNSLPVSEAERELLKCCGSQKWAQLVIAERPFKTADTLLEKSESVWWALEPHDWLEAFHSHPKIGEKKAASAVGVDAQRWSEEEQSGTRDSAKETMEALAELNRSYEEKFGYIFIVCASGKTSEEMLALLRERLKNNHAEELRNAAAEQAKITRLRLLKLLEL